VYNGLRYSGLQYGYDFVTQNPVYRDMPTTAGEQQVIDTWDLTSLDGAWRLLFKLNI